MWAPPLPHPWFEYISGQVTGWSGSSPIHRKTSCNGLGPDCQNIPKMVFKKQTKQQQKKTPRPSLTLSLHTRSQSKPLSILMIALTLERPTVQMRTHFTVTLANSLWHTHKHCTLWSSWWLRRQSFFFFLISHTLIVISCKEDALLLRSRADGLQAEVTLGCCWPGSSGVWSCWGLGRCWSWGCDCCWGWTWSGCWACCWGWLSACWGGVVPEPGADWVDSWESCSLLARDFNTAFSLSSTEFLSYSSLICSFKTSTSSRTAYIKWLFTRSYRTGRHDMKKHIRPEAQEPGWFIKCRQGHWSEAQV